MRSHKHYILCIVWRRLLLVRLLKVYLLVLMEKCTSYITSELMKLCIFWYVPTVTHPYPQIIDLFICNSLIGHIDWRGRESRAHTATPFIAQMTGKTYTFQARVSSYNFTANHQTFTISRILN